MAVNLRGVMVALLTPFDGQQKLDKESLRRLVRFNLRQGVDGLYVGGSTGEAFVQSGTERQEVLEIVAEEAKGKMTLIAHVGCVSTLESQQLARAAVGYGYDAVSAVTPFYYPFSFEEHCAHYQAIIESADGLPMVVYNIPALSGVKLTLDQINTLVTLPGVGALKQTSGDLFQMEQIRRAHPDLVLYNGYDEIFASGLLAGADGGIGSTYNIMGWRYQGMVAALKVGDVAKAQQLQCECNKVIDLLIKTGVFRGLKTVLHYMDVVSVPLCRKPFAPVDEKFLPELKALAQQLMQEHG
ncbi:N-acetylneuraminate lyase [Klebsiella quasipneumoniae]|uniref:N-acetylneuraminate lyase n=1 Tax=Klebsiella quasipneumoniae TaxID=1463165 RepID=UPI00255B07C2|nr:N-acetylneuraminate lyase [Klebsiella quasipneumoniae]HCA9876953.1 N-acetylneuraminate lyase [Klebsiella quasipneumoniae subsp. similipneumoniae]MDL4567329.1 N-acetylneuraminate lyase [Klebsiella quasipneumoniae]MDL4590308.1 N-acetylneuraminate lyase [Klebsiella quasipneumoniae]MDL4590678.1 N-acetylneuraminate lyase [Klebsiella quasipneumoniae]MDL4595792.1 N-acetylneuraminate lyase [Klebsiella quasipneumoniae]